MKPGQFSRTAVLVCMGRAIAHGTTPPSIFSDPTALALLPDDKSRKRVEEVRSGAKPRGLRARGAHFYFSHQAQVMVARTVAIDEAIVQARAPQVVILGAGLDGRAWRMSDLREAVVFEVDHPDTQRQKRARTHELTQTARDVRFVEVDFERDSLDDALKRAGHDETRATTWIWEGVVMYLSQEAIETTLRILNRRSATGSRVIVLYHSPAMLLRFVGGVLGRMGEPLRSAFTPDAMSALLAKHGFRVIRDEDMGTVGAKLTEEIAKVTQHARHLRIAVADRDAQ